MKSLSFEYEGRRSGGSEMVSKGADMNLGFRLSRMLRAALVQTICARAGAAASAAAALSSLAALRGYLDPPVLDLVEGPLVELLGGL